MIRATPGALLGLAVLALSGCGGGEQGFEAGALADRTEPSAGSERNPQPTPPRSPGLPSRPPRGGLGSPPPGVPFAPPTVELIAVPGIVTAGEMVSLSVRNGGDRTVGYGLESDVERYTDGGWVDASDDVFGRRHLTPLILGIAEPGETAGPRIGAISDAIHLPSDLEPGRYRISKRVNVYEPPRRFPSHRDAEMLTISAEVQVRSPDQSV